MKNTEDSAAFSEVKQKTWKSSRSLHYVALTSQLYICYNKVIAGAKAVVRLVP